MSSDITFSFGPSEIITAGTILELKLRSPVSLDAVQKSIQVLRDTNPVDAKFTVEGTVVRIHTQNFPPGPYYVNIIDLKDMEGQELKTPVVPHYVLVTPLRGTVPSEYRIHNAIHLVFEELQTTRLTPGSKPFDGADYIELVKTSHRETRALKQFTFDTNGNDVDADKKFKALEDRRFAKYGKLNESLYHLIETMDDKEALEVLVSPVVNFDITGYDRQTEGEIREQPQSERGNLAKIGNAHLQAIENVGGQHERTLASGLAVPTVLTVAQIRQLGRSPDVGHILQNKVDGLPLLSNSMGISFATNVLPPNGQASAQGIKVGVWEHGPDAKNLLSIAGAYKANPTMTEGHSTLVHGIIKNIEPGKPHGYAPDCDLHSVNETTTDALDWAFYTAHITVLNMSFYAKGEAKNGNFSTTDEMLDRYAMLYLFPVIVRGAGNLDGADGVSPIEDQYVVAKGFNVISVGSHDDSAANMSPHNPGDQKNPTYGSTFRNPPSSNMDRELPHICANGYDVSAVNNRMTGTSFATPAVSGSAAVLQRGHITLKSWPSAVRAILMASSSNHVPGRGNTGKNGPKSWRSWSTSILLGEDQPDGTGILNLDSAVKLMSHQFLNSQFGLAVPQGWYVGNLSRGDCDRQTGRYDKSFLMTWPASQRHRFNIMKFKAVLVWESKIVSWADGRTESRLACDMDLVVFEKNTGFTASISATRDNSHEIAEFWGKAETEYQIDIVVYPDSFYDAYDHVKFALAWQVVESTFNDTP